MTLMTPPPQPDQRVDLWTQFPVHLQIIENSRATTTRSSLVRFNEVFDFESDLFVGKVLIRIKGVDETTDATYFANRERKTQVVWQGRFLRDDLRLDDIATGQSYTRPLRLKPPAWIDKILRGILQRVAPGVDMDLQSEQPHVWAPFFASCQSVRADVPGSEPDITAVEGITEDVNACFVVVDGGDVAQDEEALKGMIATKQLRRKNLGSPSVASNFKLDPNLVYTMEHYDHFFDYYKYTMNMMNYDIGKVVNSEPMQIAAQVKSTGEYLWAFRIWHERMLSSEEKTNNKKNVVCSAGRLAYHKTSK